MIFASMSPEEIREVQIKHSISSDKIQEIIAREIESEKQYQDAVYELDSQRPPIIEIPMIDKPFFDKMYSHAQKNTGLFPCDYIGPNHFEETYWDEVALFAQKMNDEANTGLIIPPSVFLLRYSDARGTFSTSTDFGCSPYYYAFYQGAHKYTGQIMGFFDLGNFHYQALSYSHLEKIRIIDFNISSTKVKLPKYHFRDWQYPTINFIVQMKPDVSN